MLTYRQLSSALSRLALDPARPVLAHVSLSAFGQVQGGAETLLGALLSVCGGLMMPAFTYKTMVTPEIGPPDNGLEYGSAGDANLMAEFWQPNMPADRLMGRVAECLRSHPRARRSNHPLLSFTGIRVEAALEAQTLAEPLAPVAALADADGYVLLVGVDHTVNTSIHYGEKLAGRKQFVRWALTPQGVIECPGFPGASDGFEQIAPHLEDVTRRVTIGGARLQAIPLPALLETTQRLIGEDPLALLPEASSDPRVDAVRQSVGVKE